MHGDSGGASGRKGFGIRRRGDFAKGMANGRPKVWREPRGAGCGFAAEGFCDPIALGLVARQPLFGGETLGFDVRLGTIDLA